MLRFLGMILRGSLQNFANAKESPNGQCSTLDRNIFSEKLEANNWLKSDARHERISVTPASAVARPLARSLCGHVTSAVNTPK